MTAATHCLLSFTSPPESDTIPAMRRRIGHVLGCVPFLVQVRQFYRVGDRVLCLATLPFTVACQGPSYRGRRGYCRALPKAWNTARCHKLLRTLYEAYSRLSEVHDDPRRRRVFIGRPLVVAAEHCYDHIRLSRFTRTDWSVFVFPTPSDRDRSYMFYLLTQAVLADLLRLSGHQVRIAPGASFEVAFGDAVSQ